MSDQPLLWHGIYCCFCGIYCLWRFLLLTHLSGNQEQSYTCRKYIYLTLSKRNAHTQKCGISFIITLPSNICRLFIICIGWRCTAGLNRTLSSSFLDTFSAGDYIFYVSTQLCFGYPICSPLTHTDTNCCHSYSHEITKLFSFSCESQIKPQYDHAHIWIILTLFDLSREIF